MKVQLTIEGQSYEVEIKAKDNRNLYASKKATDEVLQYLHEKLLNSFSHERSVNCELLANETYNNANSIAKS